MKKTNVLLIIILYSISILMTMSCNSDSASVSAAQAMKDVKGISNWSSIKSIGAAYISTSSKGSRSVDVNTSENGNAKLIGYDDSGDCVVLTFLDTNNKEIKQEMYLAEYNNCTRFMFLGFSAYNPSTIQAMKSCSPSMGSNYYCVLDKTSGKIYSLMDFRSIYLVQPGESNDAFFFSGSEKESEDKIYKMTVENNLLKIEPILDKTKFSSWRGLVADRYGNIYSKTFKYMITVGGQLKRLEADYYMGMNNIVYCGTQCINKSGELEASSFTPPNSFHIGTISEYDSGRSNDYLLKQVGNEYYYYVRNKDEINSTYYQYYKKIIKITYLDDDHVKYSYEEIPLQNYDDATLSNSFYKMAITASKIYFLTDTEVFYYVVTTGKKVILSSSYFFNTLSTDGAGNVYFSGLDSNRNEVNGVIDPDTDAVSLNITNTNSSVVYLHSLN